MTPAQNPAPFPKDTIKAAIAEGKALISLFSKKVIEESVAATKTIMGAKSIHEAIELQTGFAKMCFNAYVGQMKIVNELFAGTAKEALAPLQVRFAAFSQITQSATTA
jgi:phasin family protein